MSQSPGVGGPSPDKPPKVRLAKGQEVSLGCGTLVLIALIVLFFSNRDGDELRGMVREIEALKKSVDAQAAEIRMLRERLPPPPKWGEGKEKGEGKGKE